MLTVKARFAILVAAGALLFAATAGIALAAPSDLDPTFDGDGIVTATLPPSNGLAPHIAFTSDGKLVAATNCLVGSNWDFCVARFNTNGSLDTSFAGVGSVITDISGNFDAANAVAVQADGKIVAGGACGPNVYSYFCIARYNVDGSLDTSFSGDGMVITDVAQSSGQGNGGTGGSQGQSLLLQPDGKLVLVGFCGSYDQNFQLLRDACAARYNPDGTLDSTFSGDGLTVLDLGTVGDFINSAALQPDGAIVMGGYCGADVFSARFCVARMTSSGGLDGSFPVALTVMGSAYSAANDVAVTSTGGVVASGSCLVAPAGVQAFCVARYTASGALDTTFNGTGREAVVVGVGGGYARAMTLSASDSILVAGHCIVNTAPSTQDFCLARFNPDGTLDASFGNGGTTSTHITGSDYVGDVQVAASGKFVVAGFCASVALCLARYIGDPIDTQPPAITLTVDPVDSQAGSGWYNAATSGTDGVLIHVSATDATAVLSVACTDNGTQVYSTKNATGTFVLGDGMHSISCAGDDGVNPPGAGTGSTTMPFLINVDKTGPTVTCVVNAVVLHSTPASVKVGNVTDGTSGPASPDALFDSPPTSVIGLRPAAVTVSDVAGNTTNASCTYRGVYVFTGFGAPISSSTLSYVNAVAGKVIPFRFTLADANGVPQAGLASVAAAEIAGTCSGTSGTLAATDYLKGGKTGLVVLGTGSYEYDWKAARKDGGLCRLVNLTLADGMTYGATILFAP
jgi:uncharacterized delta-60 repeat protein